MKILRTENLGSNFIGSYKSVNLSQEQKEVFR